MSRGNGQATSPMALPRASWQDTLKRTILEFKEDSSTTGVPR